jgi:hypothetical protein
MPDVHSHEIVLRGRLGDSLLRPFLDDFTVDHDAAGLTRLVGTVRDPSHLHGLVAYLASINAELICITPVVPTITPVVPTITPVVPTITPVVPTITPVVPTITTRSTS